MDYILIVKPPGGQPQNYPLPHVGIFTVGREAPADLVLSDPFLSRSHFQLDCNDGIFNLKDLGSRNGTLVNGVAVTQSSLRHGDSLFAGGSLLRLSAVLDGRPGAPLMEAGPKRAPALAGLTRGYPALRLSLCRPRCRHQPGRPSATKALRSSLPVSL